MTAGMRGQLGDANTLADIAPDLPDAFARRRAKDVLVFFAV